jgi:hypothetical protein
VSQAANACLQWPNSQVFKPNHRTAGFFMGVFCIAASAISCGGTTAAPQPSADQITGAASCSAAESQNLTFSGALTGHVACSTSRAQCSTMASIPSLAVPINASVAANAAQLVMVFRFFRENLTHDQPGIYAAGRLGDEQDSSSYGASLDGAGHWETPTPGGSMTLSTDDAAGAAGTIDIKLTMGDKAVAVSGTWRCVRP